jgi:cytochrome c oxidase subunit IV
MIMKSNRPTGIFLLIIPPLIFLIYIYLLFASSLDLLLIKLTIVGTAGIIVSVFIWIGYTMISTSNANEITDDNI